MSRWGQGRRRFIGMNTTGSGWLPQCIANVPEARWNLGGCAEIQRMFDTY